MQVLVNIEQKSLAIIFANYLQSLGIKAAIDDNKTINGWAVLCSEDHIHRARGEFEQFIVNPHNPRYQQVAWASGRSIKLANSSGLGKQIKDNFITHSGPFTIAIFLLCWLIFAATFLLFGDSLYQAVLFNQTGDIAQTFSQPWRFITPALFHYSLLHIAFNTMWWWQLGGQIEKQLGITMIVSLFFISAILSNTAQYLVSGPGFGGLSGVVYATLGFVWWYGHLNPGKGIELSSSIVGFMLFWLVLGYTEFMPINVANTAHLVGLLSGMAYAVLINSHQKRSNRNARK